MTVFERSPAGQENRAIFFGVDFICYVEGDPEQRSGIDVAFWSEVLRSFPDCPTIHFVCRGGKPILEQLAASVVEDNLSKVLVAMDRDYSEFREGRFIDDARVFYTYGYSWENDAFDASNLPKVAARGARLAQLPQKDVDRIRDDLERLRTPLGRFVFADFIALLKGGSVFDRSRPGRYSSIRPDGRPQLALERCILDVRRAHNELKGHVMRPANGFRNQPLRFFWGKAYEHYVKLSLQKSIRSFGNRNCTPEHLRDLAISCFAQCLQSGQNSEVLDHYRASYERFRASCM